MFTGLVEELGELTARVDGRDAARLTVRGARVSADAAVGASIAVNGVCLTVVQLGDGEFTVDVIGETLRRSSLGPAGVGDRVNLERAVRLGDRLGGHLVQGHVDGTGVLLSRENAGRWEVLRFGLPARLSRYLVDKGSITVDGVSLTVVEAGADEFSVGLIPTTREATTLGLLRPGEIVNLEVDVVAKYVERLAAPHLRLTGPAVRDNGGEEVQ